MNEAQVVAGSTLKENGSLAGTAEQRMIKRIDEERAKGRGKEAIEAAKNEKPIDAGTIKRKAEEIGASIDRDPVTHIKIRTPEELSRFNDFTTLAEHNRDFAENGYDRMDPARKPEFKTSLESAILSNPALSAEYNSLPPAEQQARLERILKDPKVASSLKEVMGEVLVHKITMGNDQIQDFKEDVKDKETKSTAVGGELTVLKAQVAALETAWKDFDASTVPPGYKAEDIRKGLLARDAVRAELNTWKTNLTRLESELGNLENQKIAMVGAKYKMADIKIVEGQISAKKADVDHARVEADSRQAKLDSLKELQAEETDLKEKKAAAEEKQRLKAVEAKTAEQALAKAKRLLGTSELARADQEDILVNGMKTAATEAARRYLIKEAELNQTAYGNLSVEENKKTGNMHEAPLLRALETQYQGSETTRKVGVVGFRRDEVVRPIDKNRVEVDFSMLMSKDLDKGPEGVLQKLYQSQVNPATSAPYTFDEVKALLADKSKDSLYKKMESEMVKQLLERKLHVSRPSANDIHIIVSSSWGQGMIDKAIDKNTEWRSMMERVNGVGALSKPGFKGRFIQKAEQNPMLLYSILGIPLLLAGAAGMSAKDYEITG
jgi:hypothetical protein